MYAYVINKKKVVTFYILEHNKSIVLYFGDNISIRIGTTAHCAKWARLKFVLSNLFLLSCKD